MAAYSRLDNTNTEEEKQLFRACSTGDLDTVKASQVSLRDVRDHSSNEFSPLHWATRGGHMNIVKYLVNDVHCDPNVQDCYGETPLHWACGFGYIDIVKYLVSDAHCHPDVQDFTGWTPLHEACKWNNTPVVEYLLTKCRCDVNCTTNSIYRSTPLILTRDPDIIRLLLQHGALATDVYHCSTILPYRSPREAAKSTIAVFMVGDKGAGKSTLTKALMTEKEGINRFTTRWSKVGGVKTKTTGIECHWIESTQVGNLSIYDLAGHREFHNAHDTVIRNAISGPSAGIFLFVIDMSLSLDVLQRTIPYWLSFIQNQISITTKMPPTQCHAKPHLLAVGSHADSVESKTELREKESIVRSKCESADKVKFVEYVTVDCRYSKSSSLKQLRSHIWVSHNELQDTCSSGMAFNVHCFHVYLVSMCRDKPAIQLGNLMEIIKSNILSSEEAYVQFLPQNLATLKEVCSDLNNRGIMLFLQAQTVKDSWIIIDKDLLLHEVNGTVFAPDDSTEHRELTRTGVVTYSRIYEVFENAIKSKKIDPELIVHFLIHMEFCQEVKEVDKNVLKLVTETHPMHEKEQYFLFPALTKPEPPRDLWRPNPLISYSEYSSCCVLQCHGHQHYLSPRFHQVLLLRLAFTHALPVEPHEADPTSPTLQQACTFWKNGIKWTTTSSVDALVEISDHRVVLLLRCKKGKELALVKIRAKVIKDIIKAKNEFCSSSETVESFVLNPQYPVDSKTAVSISKLAHSLSQHEEAVHVDPQTPVDIDNFLFFEPYRFCNQQCLVDINSEQLQPCTLTPQFVKSVSRTIERFVPDFLKVLNVHPDDIHVAVDGAYHKAERMFQVWQKQTEGTYHCLRQHMDKYSVFSGRNILEIANVPLTSLPTPSVVTSQQTLCKLDSQPTRQELHALPHNGDQINIIETIAAKWKRVGIALCLNRHRIDIIQSDALPPNQTEKACRAILEHWLEGRGATWRALIRALEDVEENVLVSQLKDALQ